MAATAANVHDLHLLRELLHGHETAVWGQLGDQGRGEVIHALAPPARNLTHRRYRGAGHEYRIEQRKNSHKSPVRAKLKQPFLVLKMVFGFRQVRYRGLAKNAERLNVAFSLINLLMLRRASFRLAQERCRWNPRKTLIAARIDPRRPRFRMPDPAMQVDGAMHPLRSELHYEVARE